MGTKTLMTIEQFDQLPEKEGILYELNEGELVTIPAPVLRHDLVRQNIWNALQKFVEPRALGWATIRIGYQLGPDTVRIPDVSFVPEARVRALDLDSRIQGAPALAIEVVSPTDSAQELRQKVKQYLAAGSRAVWVFHPKLREVEVSRTDGTTFIRREYEPLEEPELLPGFSLDLKAVFE